MSSQTAIEWTDQTDNIIVVKGGGWWCRKISPGCANCYAARLNLNSFYGGNKLAYSGQPPELILRREILDGWKRQTRPRRHFVASMTDIFGEWVPREWQFEFLDAMTAAPLQTFQLLTKRADVMTRAVCDWCVARGRAFVPTNIWLGFTAENQEWFDRRLRQCHELQHYKRILFISAEPLLSDINFGTKLNHGWFDWVIAGGESGPGARPSNPDWFRSLRDQCVAASQPFFFKQWGEWTRNADLHHLAQENTTVEFGPERPGEYRRVYRVGKKLAGRMLDGREWNEFPTL